MARALATRRARPAAAAALLRQLPPNRAALAILAAIVLVASFSLAALPGYVNRMSDEGLRRAVADARSFERNISLTQVVATPRSVFGAGSVSVRSLADVEQLGGTLRAMMPPIVQGVVARQTVAIDAPRWAVQGPPGAPPVGTRRFLQLRLQSGIEGEIALVAGRLPAPRAPASLAALTGNPAAGGDALPVYETALSPATAGALAVGIGDRLIAAVDPAYLGEVGLRAPPNEYRIIVEVVGLFEARDPANEYWFDDPRLLQPGVFETPDVTMTYGAGLLAPDAFAPLLNTTGVEPWTYQWRYFIDPARLEQDRVVDLEAGVRRLASLYAPPTRASSGLPDLTRRYADQRLLAVSVLALAAAGGAATALAVVGVLAALLGERRRAGLALIRGRGASVGQFAAAQAAEGFVVALPAALVGGAAAVAWLPPPEIAPAALAALAAALLAVVALVVATSAVVRQGGAGLARRQGEGRRALAPRLVLEGLVVALAIIGVVLLRRRGLTAPGQLVDPYLVAVPILLGLVTGIALLRLLPPLVAALARPAARGRGLLPLLATRRLARPSGAQLAVVAVLLAVALATFATIIQGSIDTALSDAAWRRVGADYRVAVPVPAGQPPAAIDLAGVAGVAATARGALYPEVTIAPAAIRLGNVMLLAIEPAPYAAVIAGTPLGATTQTTVLEAPTGARPGSREDPLPAIVSARWVAAAPPRPGERFALDLGGAEVNFLAREVRADFPGLEPNRPFVIVPLAGLRAAERLPAAPVAVTYARAPASAAGPIADTVRAQAPPPPGATAGTPTAFVTDRQAEYNRARGLPLVAGVTDGFRWGGTLLAVLALGAVIAAAEQVGRERARERGYLRLLGLSPRGARALALLELVPPLALAALAGATLGAALIRILGPAIDLASFAAPGGTIALRADPRPIALLVVAVIAAATAASLLLDRRGGRPGGAAELLREVDR